MESPHHPLAALSPFIRQTQSRVWLNVLPTMDLYSLGRKRTPWLALSGTILEPLKSLGGLDASWDTES